MSYAFRERPVTQRIEFWILTALSLAVLAVVMIEVSKTTGGISVPESNTDSDTGNCGDDEKRDGENDCECGCGCGKTVTGWAKCVMCLFGQCQK